MEAYIKRFSDFRTIGKLTSISSDMAIDSIEAESSQMTIHGNDVSYENIGDWLIFDGAVYRIAGVKPDNNRSTLTLSAPLDAFSRPIELALQSPGETVGEFVSNVLLANWRDESDPVYAVPYLVVSYSDTAAYVPPEIDKNGCFELPEYCRLMRKSHRIRLEFSISTDNLICSIKTVPVTTRQVSFEDGRSQLKNVAFSAGSLAKVTVLCDTDTGEKDEDGNKITVRSRTDWYLSDNGDVTDEVPENRAAGDWGTILIKESDDPQAKAAETFAKKSESHKLEFWSTRDLSVQDSCTFCVYGKLLTSHISCKRKSSSDNRFYYKSGELATTVTEKLKGVMK
ncbi:MAG: hypothetical protein J6V25_07970 [Oscillospiraceae bacterium]|nr:hypothetical protein [Oscillospiraceae bacterium]